MVNLSYGGYSNANRKIVCQEEMRRAVRDRKTKLRSSAEAPALLEQDRDKGQT